MKVAKDHFGRERLEMAELDCSGRAAACHVAPIMTFPESRCLYIVGESKEGSLLTRKTGNYPFLFSKSGHVKTCCDGRASSLWSRKYFWRRSLKMSPLW